MRLNRYGLPLRPSRLLRRFVVPTHLSHKHFTYSPSVASLFAEITNDFASNDSERIEYARIRTRDIHATSHTLRISVSQVFEIDHGALRSFKPVYMYSESHLPLTLTDGAAGPEHALCQDCGGRWSRDVHDGGSGLSALRVAPDVHQLWPPGTQRRPRAVDQPRGALGPLVGAHRALDG